MSEELIEKLADFFHMNWQHWMKYLFSTTQPTYIKNEKYMNKGIGEIIMPTQVERWKRQRITPYSELSEKEKDSDREWAIKLLKLIQKDLNNIRDEKINELLDL